VATFNSESGLGFDMAYRPGTLKEMLKQMASGNPDETYQPEPMRVEYQEREPRLALMEQQGVERCVIFPAGMALAAEHYVIDRSKGFIATRDPVSGRLSIFWKLQVNPRTYSGVRTEDGHNNGGAPWHASRSCGRICCGCSWKSRYALRSKAWTCRDLRRPPFRR
jgi:hypothetical protein